MHPVQSADSVCSDSSKLSRWGMGDHPNQYERSNSNISLHHCWSLNDSKCTNITNLANHRSLYKLLLEACHHNIYREAYLNHRQGVYWAAVTKQLCFIDVDVSIIIVSFHIISFYQTLYSLLQVLSLKTQDKHCSYYIPNTVHTTYLTLFILHT